MSTAVNPLEVRIGFVALLDAAPIVAARELGLFERHGVRTVLRRELGWANIRDKLDYGELEAGHCPAAVLPVHALGSPQPERRLMTAVGLGAGCNVVTLSRKLWEQGVRDLAGLVAAAKARRDRPLRFGHVLGASSHHLLLRYWLAAGGLDPESDVRFQVVPPPLMAQTLAAEHLDGYCVGEPWNQTACRRGEGWPIAATSEIYPGHPEKVLAVRGSWADHNPGIHRGLVRALVDGARWCDEPANRAALAKMLAQPRYLGVEADLLTAGLEGRVQSPYAARRWPDFPAFFRNHATFPFRSQLIWLLTQLVRWRMAPATIDYLGMSRMLYRPDLYREWTADMNVPCPRTDLRTETMFDGRALDPMRAAHFLR